MQLKFIYWKWFLVLSAIKLYHHVSFAQFSVEQATVPASEKYIKPSAFKKFFQGKNYRQEWETPVTMPVFKLNETNLKIVEMGGGQQTTSLELVDDLGREWALRSVDKEVMPPKKFMENTFMERVIQDLVSGSYPYAGLSVYEIAKAAGILAGEQKLYYVPDEPRFGEYRSAMANKVFILVNNQPQIEKNILTEEMLEKLSHGKNYYVDQKEYLKARLVDWLVADWDRHDGQWRWMERRTDSGIAFQIVSRDRDQAFYRSNGILAKIAGLFFMPHINKFNDDARGIKGLSKKTRHFDKQFTDQLKKEDWERTIREFQNNVTDSVIELAIKKQPPEIFAIHGDELIEKLKSRRDGLFKHVMKYYFFLKRYN